MNQLLKAIAGLALGAPLMAHALVTWSFGGVVDQGSPGQLGSAISVDVTFDPSAGFLGIDALGRSVLDGSSVSMQYRVGGGSLQTVPSGGGTILLRDNFDIGGGLLVDGLSFSLTQQVGSFANTFNIVLRDADLDLISGTTLPSSPDSRWTVGSGPGDSRQFQGLLGCAQGGDCGAFTGTLTSGVLVAAPIPEPETWMLMASGLIAGFAYRSRRGKAGNAPLIAER